jgi:hypothetical protein
MTTLRRGLLTLSLLSVQCLYSNFTGFHRKKIIAPLPFPPDKLIKTPIRVNLLAYGFCNACSSSIADEVEHTYRRNHSEFIKEWVTHLAKTT